MEERGPPIKQHAVQVLTRSYQFDGRLEVIGNTLDSLNDTTRDTLVLHQVCIDSLTPGGPIRDLDRSQVHVPKEEIVFLYLTEPGPQAEVRLLAREESLIVHTPLAVVRGGFHMPVEARIADFVSLMPGSFLTVTDAKLFLLTELPSPYPESCDLLLIGKQHVEFYHPA